MTITELIAKLEEIRAEHGDLQVGMQDGESHGFRICTAGVGQPKKSPGSEEDDSELGPLFVQIFEPGGPW